MVSWPYYLTFVSFLCLCAIPETVSGLCTTYISDQSTFGLELCTPLPALHDHCTLCFWLSTTFFVIISFWLDCMISIFPTLILWWGIPESCHPQLCILALGSLHCFVSRTTFFPFPASHISMTSFSTCSSSYLEFLPSASFCWTLMCISMFLPHWQSASRQGYSKRSIASWHSHPI